MDFTFNKINVFVYISNNGVLETKAQQEDVMASGTKS